MTHENIFYYIGTVSLYLISMIFPRAIIPLVVCYILTTEFKYDSATWLIFIALSVVGFIFDLWRIIPNENAPSSSITSGKPVDSRTGK